MTADVPKDIAGDVSKDVSEDVVEDVSNDLSEMDVSDLPVDVPEDLPPETCELGVMMCTLEGFARRCSLKMGMLEWEDATCDPAKECIGAGECVPTGFVNDVSLNQSHTMTFDVPIISVPESLKDDPAWESSALGYEVVVFGAWRAIENGRRHGVVQTDYKDSGRPSTLRWADTFHVADTGFTHDGNCAEFGRSLAISEDGLVLAVGAPGLSLSSSPSDCNARGVGSPKDGAVYVFTRDQAGSAWVWNKTLKQKDRVEAVAPNAGSLFGLSVAMSPLGDRLFVGVPKATAGGEVYEYSIDRTTSSLVTSYVRRVFSSPMEDAQEFGASIDYAAGRLVIGARLSGGPTAQMNYGAVFVADVDSSSSDLVATKLTTPTTLGNLGARLGQSVSISGDGSRVVAGAPGAPLADGNKGRVISWDVGNSLAASPQYIDKPVTLDQDSSYGSSVSISHDGDTVLIGAKNDGNKAQNKGGMGLFPKEGAFTVATYNETLSDWSLVQTKFGDVHPERANFGSGISKVTRGGRFIVSSGSEERSRSTNIFGVFYEFVLTSD